MSRLSGNYRNSVSSAAGPDDLSGRTGRAVSIRTARSVWRWFRIDVPARVLPLIAIPLVWAVGWGGGVGSVGLKADFPGWWWIAFGLLAVAVALVSTWFVVRQGGAGSRATPGALALELPFFLVLNPVAEELFFRGLAQRQIEGAIGFVPALLLVSVVFGFHHALAGFRLPFLILATVGGLLFGTVMAVYDSVLPAIGLHVAADIGIFVAGPWWVERRARRIEKSG